MLPKSIQILRLWISCFLGAIKSSLDYAWITALCNISVYIPGMTATHCWTLWRFTTHSETYGRCWTTVWPRRAVTQASVSSECHDTQHATRVDLTHPMTVDANLTASLKYPNAWMAIWQNGRQYDYSKLWCRVLCHQKWHRWHYLLRLECMPRCNDDCVIKICWDLTQF